MLKINEKKLKLCSLNFEKFGIIEIDLKNLTRNNHSLQIHSKSLYKTLGLIYYLY